VRWQKSEGLFLHKRELNVNAIIAAWPRLGFNGEVTYPTRAEESFNLVYGFAQQLTEEKVGEERQPIAE